MDKPNDGSTERSFGIFSGNIGANEVNGIQLVGVHNNNGPLNLKWSNKPIT